MEYPLTTTVREMDLHGESETRKFNVITTAVQSMGLVSAKLVYCGIEGEPYKQGNVPLRSSTFGYTFREFEATAREIDRYGSSDSETPIVYAFDAEISPAIVAYDSDELIPHELEHNVWKALPGKYVEDAARLVIYLTHDE